MAAVSGPRGIGTIPWREWPTWPGSATGYAPAFAESSLDASELRLDEEALEHYLADLAEAADHAGNDATAAVDEILTQEAALREDTAADGAPDERLLVDLDLALRDLERASVRPLGEDAETAADAARWTVAMAFVTSTIAWGAAAWLAVREAQGQGRFPPPRRG